MSLRPETASSLETSTVRLLAAGGRLLASGWSDSGTAVSGTVAPRHWTGGLLLEDVVRPEPSDEEPWDAFEGNSDEDDPEGWIYYPDRRT